MFIQYYLSYGSLIVLLAFGITSNSLLAQGIKRDSLLKELHIKRTTANLTSIDTLFINNIIELANEYRHHDLDSLLSLSQESLKLSKKASFINGQIGSYRNIGIFYSDKGNIDQAIYNYKKANNLADNHKSLHLKVETLNDLSTEYNYQGNYALALKGYLDAIEIAEKLDFKSFLSIINENIAQLYLDQKDYKHAMVFFKKVNAINEEIGNPIYMAETMSNMASAYADMNELEYAMFNINSSITIFEKERILEWLAYCYETKGKIYLKMGKNTWALYWYKQSELLHKEIEDDRGKIALLNGMSEAYFNIRKDSVSELYALAAFDLSNKIGLRTGIKNCTYQLFKIYKNRADYKKSLLYHEIFQETSKSLAKSGNEKALNILKTKMEYDQQKKQLIIENEKALAKQKTYIYIFVIILFIFLAIVLIIRRNEQIQKKLNTELLSNKLDLEEKQEYLNELNQTKNKLFSIIGHDLRGPIGAFQGLLRLFKEGEMTKDEFLNFVPKLKIDIDTISFTLNNLLSWGQTQMNGSATTPIATNLYSIVEENIALLSEIAESKSIKLISRIESNCQIWADFNQVDIIIRNLLSNALKFTPNNGQIIIGAIQKLKTCEIYIKDNGMGMSEETMGEIFKIDSNHTTYGTNDEKGTGLGLSLCKEMVEKNKGRIWVHSSLGKGSSFYFTMPRFIKPNKKSA
ncbi:tetratricopeptide repeat-containing sensor histidine kinase [Maribacter sp. ACAM166]|uniref:tetratricopeptide repeat-containing sensor histidine kinase n=1 Tax=Maribacter sp. ACAM166 TaxID=2508996 RepID=UPI0010FD4F1E|nr:tetratricopeptide repeat-containing sensor histidine kinase [Maribacter sp. ACAM166]TLP79617.1 sensor histidine kinase [Maribacter sp. ACAM166]